MNSFDFDVVTGPQPALSQPACPIIGPGNDADGKRGPLTEPVCRTPEQAGAARHPMEQNPV